MRAAIRAIQPSDDRSSYAELAHALRSLALSSKMPVEGHLFSDMQQSSMPPSFADAALGDNVTLVLHPAAQGSLPNFAVESVTAPAPYLRRQKSPHPGHDPRVRRRCGSRRVTLVLNGHEIGIEICGRSRLTGAPPLSLPASTHLTA